MNETQPMVPPIDLGPEKILNFLHIPKTGGSSVRYFLDHFFLPNWIVPAEQGHIDHSAIDALPESLCKTFAVVRGHLCHDLLAPFLQRCGKDPVAFTILRRPEDRLLSEYDMAMNNPFYRYHDELVAKNISLEEFMQHPDLPWVSAGNTQTRHLALQSRTLADIGENLQSVANETLDACAVVGVQDKLPQCLQMLCYVLGLPPVKVTRLNAARPGTRYRPTEKERCMIRERNHLDIALFDQVSREFDQKYAWMLSELGFDSNRENPPATEVDCRLAEHAAQRRQQRLEAIDDGDWFEIVESQGLLTSFLRRPVPKLAQWIGPEPKAELKLQFKDQADKLVYLDAAMWADESVLENLYLAVNDKTIPLSQHRRDDGCVLTGFIPSEIIRAEGSTTRIELGSSHVGPNHSCELYPQYNSELPVCFALSGLAFRSV